MGDDPMPVFVFGCVACGKTVEGNETSCPRCGASFEDVRFECPFCGELVSPTERRCPACGTEFGAFSQGVSGTASVDLDGAEVSAPAEEPKAEPKDDIVSYECPSCGKPVSENDAKCPHCGVLFS